MSFTRGERGRRGEDLAVKALKKRGYRIVERNYRCRHGELDVVAELKGVVVFVEVKARTSGDFGSPLEAVNFRKRRKLEQVAAHYALEKGLCGVAMRFDVVGVNLAGRDPEVEVVPNAFEIGD